MKTAKVISAIGVLAMLAAIGYGFLSGDFASDGARLLRNPWGIVSLVDLYTGFALFSLWIVYRERSGLQAGLWILSLMVLGSLAAALYTLIALYRSDEDWATFWMGKAKAGQ